MEKRMMLIMQIPVIQQINDKWLHMIYCQMRSEGGGGDTTAGIAYCITSAAGQI